MVRCSPEILLDLFAFVYWAEKTCCLQGFLEELLQAARQEEERKQSSQGLLTKLRKNFK